jgi:hypothetical protein
MPKEKPLPDGEELSRRMVQQITNAKEMIELARQIRKQAIEMRKNSQRKNIVKP